MFQLVFVIVLFKRKSDPLSFGKDLKRSQVNFAFEKLKKKQLIKQKIPILLEVDRLLVWLYRVFWLQTSPVFFFVFWGLKLPEGWNSGH